jgi:hypothetical protein
MAFFKIKEFSTENLDSINFKKIKIICRKMTCKNLHIEKSSKVVIIYTNNKPIGFCCISEYSPENHFDNEKNDIYLYNFICDSNYRLKQSWFLMEYVKHKYKKNINIDIVKDNDKSEKFFIKNNFIFINKEYRNIYNSYSYKYE